MSMTNKHGNDILGMGIKSLKLACLVVSKSLAYVVNPTIDNDLFIDWLNIFILSLLIITEIHIKTIKTEVYNSMK